jgi:hypothetical protein
MHVYKHIWICINVFVHMYIHMIFIIHTYVNSHLDTYDKNMHDLFLVYQFHAFSLPMH